MSTVKNPSDDALENRVTVLSLPRPHMGSILVEAGKITIEDCDLILRTQTVHKKRFGETARELGLLADDDIQMALSRQFGFTYLSPGEYGLDEALFIASRPFGEQAEAIRTIRSQLQQTWLSTGHRLLTVVSNESGLGSELLGNLAVSFAQLGIRTLIVDANLRSPNQHRLFNCLSGVGLTDVIAGRAGENAVFDVPGFSSLRLMPAGTVPPNPQELLCRPVFGRVLGDLSAKHDVVLIDTPPLPGNLDACVVSAIARFALVTARRGTSRVRDIRSINAALTMAGVSIVGAVMADG